MSKTQEEAYNLLEEMAMNNFQWPTERGLVRKPLGVHEIDGYTSLKAQVDNLSQQLKALKTQQVAAVCALCEGPHPAEECQIGNPFQPNHANYVGQYT